MKADEGRTGREAQPSAAAQKWPWWRNFRGLCSRNEDAFKWAALLAILLFSFWAGMRPHWDYRYPLHIDEWFALGYAQATLDAGSLQYADPYSGGQISYHPEFGFHIVLGYLKSTTGLSWMELYEVAPGLLLALLAFFTYAFGRRFGFGLSAALFVPLIPSSVRTLGPAFVTPVTLAMLFIPMTLLILSYLDQTGRARILILLLLLVMGAIFFHPTTEGLITILVVLHLSIVTAVALTRRQYRQSAKHFVSIGLRLLIPIVVLSVWLPSLTKDVLNQTVAGGQGLITILGPQRNFHNAFGFLPVVLGVVGLIAMALNKHLRTLSYTIPVLFLTLTLFLFTFPDHGIGPEVLYERGWSYLGFLLVLGAGFFTALFFNKGEEVARVIAPSGDGNARLAVISALATLGVALVALAIFTGLFQNDSRDSYAGLYHVVNDEIFQEMAWLGRNMAPGEDIAVSESSIAWPYPLIAGAGAGVMDANGQPWSSPFSDELRRMALTGHADVQWLRDHQVSVLYTCWPISFHCSELYEPGLLKVHRGVYLVTGQAE